jgi:hypothetical protein
MVWNHFRQSDDLNIGPPLKATLYALAGTTPNRYTVPSSTTELLRKCATGSKRAFYGNVGGGFKPGDFKLGDCVAYEVSVLASGNGVTEIKRVLDNNIAHTLRKIHGPLALLMPTPGSTGFSVDPYKDGYDPILVSAIGRSRESQVLAALTVAELPETLGMLRPAIDAFGRKAKKLTPPRTLRRIGSALDYATSSWLTYRYGIIPTMSDIDSYREIYDDKCNVRLSEGGIEKSRAGVTEEGVKTFTPFRVNTGLFWATGTYYKSSTTRVTSTAYSRSILSKKRMYGVDLRSLLLTGYEGVPYSFVLDWVYDVGGWMRTAIPSAEVRNLGHTLSFVSETIWKTEVSTACVSIYPNIYYPEAKVTSVSTNRNRSYRRLVNPPIPQSPVVQLDFSRLTRQADALSLAWQRATSMLPRR